MIATRENMCCRQDGKIVITMIPRGRSPWRETSQAVITSRYSYTHDTSIYGHLDIELHLRRLSQTVTINLILSAAPGQQ